MRRRFIISIILLAVSGLFVLYQNAGRLPQKGTTKPLSFPRYFASIYEDDMRIRKEIRNPESFFQSSPLYKSINRKIAHENPDKNCDPQNSKAICPQDEESKPTDEVPMTFSMDPLRTLATVQMSDSLRGQLRYNSPEGGPSLFINKRLTDSSELNLQMDQGTQGSSGRVSFDIQW